MGPIGNLRDLLAALWRKAWVIILVVMIGAPLVLLFASSRPRVYEATAVIGIEAPEVAMGATGQNQTADSQLDLITQNLMARDNMLRLIADHALFEGLSPVEQVGLLRGAIQIVKLIDPAMAWRPDVQPSGLAITVRLGDAQPAADVANALLDQIVTEQRNRSEDRATRTVDFLSAEETRVAGHIAAIEGQIAAYRATHIESLPEGLTSQRDRLGRLSESRLALEQQLIELQGARDRMRAEDVAAQEARLNSQIGLVAQDMATIEAAIASAPEVERELTAMSRTLAQLEAELTVLTTRRTEAAMTQLLETQEQSARFVVLETAITPEYPVSASRKKLAMAGLVAVGLAGLGLALALELLQPAIRTAAQLERQLGVTPVVVIPELRSRSARRRRGLLWLAGFGALLATLVMGLRGRAQDILDLIGMRRAAAPAPAPVLLQGRRRRPQ